VVETVDFLAQPIAALRTQRAILDRRLGKGWDLLLRLAQEGEESPEKTGSAYEAAVAQWWEKACAWKSMESAHSRLCLAIYHLTTGACPCGGLKPDEADQDKEDEEISSTLH